MTSNEQSHADCCKGCKRRHVGCHGRCSDYAAMKRENEERKQAERAWKQSNYALLKGLHQVTF